MPYWLIDLSCRSCRHVWQDVIAARLSPLSSREPCPGCGQARRHWVTRATES